MNSFISQFARPEGAVGRMLGKVMAVSNRKMHRAVMAELGDAGRVLEIGFGSGAQLDMISSRYPGAKLYGIDISEDMLVQAEKRLGARAQLSLCDCEKTVFADSSFDAVISTDTCYFWNEPRRVLAEIGRISVPSGRLILAYNAMYAASVHRSLGTDMYSDDSIRAALEKAGMEIISAGKCGFEQRVFSAVIKK